MSGHFEVLTWQAVWAARAGYQGVTARPVSDPSETMMADLEERRDRHDRTEEGPQEAS